MFQNAEDARKFISDVDVKFVDVRFCDVPGIMQHFTVPVEIFEPEGELAFDGSSIRGFQAIHESDMKLVPDVTTAYVDPFRAEKTLNINFHIVDPYTDEPYSRDPRQVAAKAEKAAPVAEEAPVEEAPAAEVDEAAEAGAESPEEGAAAEAAADEAVEAEKAE